MSLVLSMVLVSAAVLLLLIAGILAAADSALTVRSRAELFRLAEGSGRIDRAIRAIAEDEPAHQNAIAFARVTAESIAAALVTVVLAAALDNTFLTLGLAALILTVISFILVGASPRKLGIAKPAQVVRFSALLVRFIRVFMGPIATVLLRLSSALAVRRAENQNNVAEDDNQLLSLVDKAAESDALEEDDREYIHSLLRFGETRVRETIVPRTDMQTVAHTYTVRQALEAILASRHSRMPVVADDVDDVLGIIYLRDIAGFVLRYPDEADTAAVGRVMKKAQFVPELMRADDLLAQMQVNNNHLALTVDEYGGISGLVTLEDLIEELIGEIYDESDREDIDTQKIDDCTYLISPRLQITQLGELFDIELADADVDTAAGLLMKELDRLPVQGESAQVAGIKITALEVDKRGSALKLQVQWIGDEQKDESADSQSLLDIQKAGDPQHAEAQHAEMDDDLSAVAGCSDLSR